MAKPTTKRAHPLGDLAELTAPKNVGDGLILEVRPALPMVQVFAAKGRGSDVADLLDIAAKPGSATVLDGYTAIPLAPNQWMLIAQKAGTALAAILAQNLKGIGHVSEQSHARVCFRISGLHARELMSRGCRLDLHPSVAKSGLCAQTQMAQIGVIIHQVSDEPTYDLYVASGFARAFWHWLCQTADQFGYRVKTG